MKKYQIIYADPPWDYQVWKKPMVITNAPRWQYERMGLAQLKSLGVSQITDGQCVLFLWTTSPNLFEAGELIKAWQFTYKTMAFVWVKLNKNGMGFATGMGHWTRANSEYCLLATKGHPKRLARNIPQIIATPRMTHSRKPDEIVRDRIIRLCGDLPRIELFARRKVEGWDCWGNEVESDIDLEV